MTENREFPTEVIASISSGIMLCSNFSEIHEAAEFLMGHPIWTHHFANKELVKKMQEDVQKQCPGMPGPNDISTENWKEKIANLIAGHGAIQKITKGRGLTAMHPTDGIPGHVKALFVVGDAP